MVLVVEGLYFYKDDKNTSEVEFLFTNADGLIPIEIKAGKKKANLPARILETTGTPNDYKMSSQNIGITGKKITLPLYMLMFLPD